MGEARSRDSYPPPPGRASQRPSMGRPCRRLPARRGQIRRNVDRGQDHDELGSIGMFPPAIDPPTGPRYHPANASYLHYLELQPAEACAWLNSCKSRFFWSLRSLVWRCWSSPAWRVCGRGAVARPPRSSRRASSMRTGLARWPRPTHSPDPSSPESPKRAPASRRPFVFRPRPLPPQSTWYGTSVTTIPFRNNSATRSSTAVWVCSRFSHQRLGTNCGTTMVMASLACCAAATRSM